MSNNFAVDAKNLWKKYPGSDDDVVEAVRGINLMVEQGTICALLGPNGAGKTTVLSILTTLLLPSDGSAQVAGFDVVQNAAEVRRRIGVTFQEIVLDEELSGRKALDFHGQLYGLSRQERNERIAELADLVELSDTLDRKIGSYSGGMKRRLELARGLMTRPLVLFLDEPTQGLDPHNRAGIWRYVRRLRDEMGMTLLLTTHYMEEAEALADHVAIIDHGQIVAEGAPTELVREMGADVVSLVGHGEVDAFSNMTKTMPSVTNVVVHRRPEGELESLSEELLSEESGSPEPGSPEYVSLETRGDSFTVQIGVDAGERRLANLVQMAAEAGFHIHEVSVAKPSLGDVFLAHTGHALRD